MEDIKLWQLILGAVLWFASQLIVAAAIYGGIRNDIKSIHVRLGDMRDDVKTVKESVVDVHKRVDKWYEDHHHV